MFYGGVGDNDCVKPYFACYHDLLSLNLLSLSQCPANGYSSPHLERELEL
jgi:hypothetical protein